MNSGRPKKKQRFNIYYYELYKNGRSPLKSMLHEGAIDAADEKLAEIQQAKKCSILIDKIEPITDDRRR